MVVKEEIVTLDKPIRLKNGTIINRFSHVLPGAEIGDNCMIGEHCYIAKKTFIGDNTRIQNHVNIWDGVYLGHDVFVGPKACFTNHRNPDKRVSDRTKFTPDVTHIGDNVTIGANATIIAPCVISQGAVIAAGAVVCRNIEAMERYYGILKDKLG